MRRTFEPGAPGVGGRSGSGARLGVAQELAQLEASPPRADLAFEGVTVVDAVSGRRPDQRVVVSGDRLVFVGPMDADAPEAARTIDGRGRFLMPGLWDAHVHFVYEPELTEAMPELFLRYGVTSVRDTGGDLDQLVALRTRWAATGRATPRFFLSGPLLDGRLVVVPLGSARVQGGHRRARSGGPQAGFDAV